MSDRQHVLRDIELAVVGNSDDGGVATAPPASFEKAGPRADVFFDPSRTRVGVVTAGGLCPGTNNVIRSVVLELFHKYGVRSIVGFRFGYGGLGTNAKVVEPLALNPDAVDRIHMEGGTILGTARGPIPPEVIVDTLVGRGIDILIAVGGDGTMAGAHAIAREVTRRGLLIAVVGIPKTIDNDIPFVDRTFGFETAVSMARVAVDAARTEAISLQNGIGLVKLMGRSAGYIAAQATIASRSVNACLIPEVPFDLEGAHGVFAYLESRLASRRHALVVVAEGCGTRLLHEDSSDNKNTAARDPSGNLRFRSAELDIGEHLKRRIGEYFDRQKTPVTIKYIDPSYMIRGVPANAADSAFCDALARHAVHAAMAGKTDVMIGRCHRVFTHVPLELVLSTARRIHPDEDLWLDVLEATGQPSFVPLSSSSL